MAATKRVCLYSSFHFLEDFFYLIWTVDGASSQWQREAKMFCEHNANHASKVTVDASSYRLPPHHFLNFFLFMKFSCVVQSATVEIPAETKKKRGGSPPFFGRFYPTCDSAEYSGRELCCCRSRFAACPRPHHNPAHQIEKETGTHFSLHDFDDPKLETTLPPLEIVT
jgi:hypothetical protein